LAVLKSIQADDRENGEANYLTGKTLLEAGKSKDALEYLKQAHRLKKDAATASALGRCYYALGEVFKAKPLLEEAAVKDIRDPGNSFLLGTICLDRGLGALAEKYLLAAQEAGMESPDLHLLLARAYLLQRKFVGPVLVKRIAGGAEPGSIVTDGVVLGPAAGTANQQRIAQKFCALYEGLQLLKAQPKQPDGLYAAAQGWFAAGDLDRAIGHLDMLAAREPDSQRVVRLRADLLIAKKGFDALEKHLASPAVQKALKGEDLGEFYYQAAMALRGEGERERALSMLAKAEKRLPTSGRVLRALGGLCLAMGKRDEATRYYARMVELFPDAEDIDELRNTLKVLKGKTLDLTPGEPSERAEDQPAGGPGDEPSDAARDEPVGLPDGEADDGSQDIPSDEFQYELFESTRDRKGD
ncbi:MAG TPA: tetratricopeptide repeat protein, partial [Phycisphaerae bacterium]|nr:tetratricopeptide repeat protein [Phycisphaerae bacterium]